MVQFLHNNKPCWPGQQALFIIATAAGQGWHSHLCPATEPIYIFCIQAEDHRGQEGWSLRIALLNHSGPAQSPPKVSNSSAMKTQVPSVTSRPNTLWPLPLWSDPCNLWLTVHLLCLRHIGTLRISGRLCLPVCYVCYALLPEHDMAFPMMGKIWYYYS